MRTALLTLLLLCGPACGQLRAEEATTVEELQADGRLQVASELSPAEGLVPGQHARLLLTVATDRWFSGGTRIVIPEVPGLVILQTEQFASNASENRGGQSWVVQRWTLDVYPQRAGNFVIPPLTLKVKINAGPAVEVEGELTAPAVRFRVSIPAALEQADHWVAAPAYSVSQNFDRPLTDLQIGDAFEREVVFEATGVMAMMLPVFEVTEQAGLAAYPAPPALDNRNNRGETSARRSQRISYVVEAAGDYLLPAREYFWWDTRRNELRLLSLSEQRFSVGGAEPATTGGAGLSSVEWLRPLLAWAAGLVAAGLVLWWAWRRLPRERLARLREKLIRLWVWLAALRKPALPSRLNPGSSAGE
ncbi:MAG: BatD family protein [Halioglobus sp.]